MAYTTATLRDIFPESDGRLHLIFVFTGNAGETPVEWPVFINTSTLPDANYLRGLAINQLSVLNTNLTVRGTLVGGVVLDTVTPLPVPASGAVWEYAAASLPFTPGATPQDIVTITGSASKTITITQLGWSTGQTTAGINTWYVVKRSSANTGGTSTSVTAVPMSDAAPAASATVLQYTANPTLGTLIGRLWTGRLVSPTVSISAAGSLEQLLSFDRSVGPILTGVTDVIGLSLNGVALPAGLSVTAHIKWIESP